MKELRRNMRIITLFSVAGLLVLIAYLCYTVFMNGNRWVNSANNTRLYAARQNVTEGDIFDRNGVKLAYSAEDGSRQYNTDSAIRLAVSQTVGDTLGMSGTGVETFHAATLYDLSGNVFDRIAQQLSGSSARDSDIYLTIDADMCAYISSRFPKGKNGAVVVLNYQTAEAYALVSLPQYDPGQVSRRTADGDINAPYLNRALQGLYPPGSTFKIVTLTAALESLPGVQGWEFNCPGIAQVGDGLITDNGGNGHGQLTLEGAFIRSCNLTFGSLALQLGDTLRSKAEAMGFNTNFLFRDMVVYNSSFPAPQSDYELCWAGVGQGRVLVTPLHMAMMSGAVANGGRMLEPKLIRSVVGDSGIPQVRTGTASDRRIMSEGTAGILRSYMRGVVESGTGTRAAVNGHSIAGKTGTAEVSSNNKAEPHAWFTGFCAEAEHPIALAIIVENAGHGGDVAAPLAADIFSWAFEPGY